MDFSLSKYLNITSVRSISVGSDYLLKLLKSKIKLQMKKFTTLKQTFIFHFRCYFGKIRALYSEFAILFLIWSVNLILFLKLIAFFKMFLISKWENILHLMRLAKGSDNECKMLSAVLDMWLLFINDIYFYSYFFII